MQSDNAEALLGIDFGGSKIECIVLAGDDIAFRRRIATPDTRAQAIQAVVNLVAAAERAVGALKTVGIGLPGSIAPASGLIHNANRTYLNGTDLQTDLSRALARPVAIGNDANCLALSEACDGAGKGASIVFACVLGTGVGGGLVINNRLVTGANGISGEWGHNPANGLSADTVPPGPCWCGRDQCLELWISGTAFERRYRARYGEERKASAIVESMRGGDIAASDHFQTWLEDLARALASVANLLDPDVIVLGGGMSNISEIYAELPRRMAPHVLASAWSSKVVPALWGDASGVRGAARL